MASRGWDGDKCIDGRTLHKPNRNAGQAVRRGVGGPGGGPRAQPGRDLARQSAFCILQTQTLRSDTRAPAEWGHRGGTNRIGGSGSPRTPPLPLHSSISTSTSTPPPPLCVLVREPITAKACRDYSWCACELGPPRSAVQARYFFCCVRAMHHWPACGGAALGTLCPVTYIVLSYTCPSSLPLLFSHATLTPSPFSRVRRVRP